jgi:hypothetical protein
MYLQRDDSFACQFMMNEAKTLKWSSCYTKMFRFITILYFSIFLRSILTKVAWFSNICVSREFRDTTNNDTSSVPNSRSHGHHICTVNRRQEGSSSFLAYLMTYFQILEWYKMMLMNS